MTTIRVEMHSAKPLRYSAPVRALCEQLGRGVAERANAQLPRGKGISGNQFVMHSRAGSAKPWGRWRVSVTAVGMVARRHNAKHNTLLRALNG